MIILIIIKIITSPFQIFLQPLSSKNLTKFCPKESLAVFSVNINTYVLV